jgi:hypothetical protein
MRRKTKKKTKKRTREKAINKEEKGKKWRKYFSLLEERKKGGKKFSLSV